MKMQVRYRKSGELRFLSHRELERAWRRALRRSGLPLELTAGYAPREKVEMGYPLPVGVAGEGEDIVIALEGEHSPAQVREQLSVVLPPGLDVVWTAPVTGKKSLFARTVKLYYQVIVNNGNQKIFAFPTGDTRSKINFWDFLAGKTGLSPEEVKTLPVSRVKVEYEDDDA